ncbi:MAG: S8 family serine peptidase [Epsilonproteobacteria bacterium]|nr:S8 family serine peptidase [Campylobacterota bacterium]
MQKIVFFLSFISVTLFGDFYFNGNKKVNLTKLHSYAPLSKSRDYKSPINYYKNDAGMRLGIDKKIIVNFSDLSIQAYIEKEFSLHFIKSLNEHMYLYSLKNSDEAIKISNKLNNIKGIKFSHPDFIIDKKTRSNDPLYNASWHFDRINVEKAWRYTKGAGVIVGVYDEGIDIEHEDLRDNIIGFGNYADGLGKITVVHNQSTLDNYDINAPRNISDKWHGTACSGVIAAKMDNGKGTTGIAPQSKLIVARYSNNNISSDIQALYDMANHGAAIISNSWGTNSMVPSFNEALEDLSERGRGGKGVLIFFAAGNDGCNMDKYYEIVSNGYEQRLECRDSSEFEEINDESESPYVISIASATYNNQIASYSNYGSAIDFVAPGGAYGDSIITTDASGSNGFVRGNYTPASAGFSGTSASAPMAAGIAALVLSENHNLSKEEVIDILKTTANKYQSRTYPYDKNGRNDHWGYGMLNAGDAVELASNYGKIKVENFAKTIYANMH